jgi:GNAT superfamily N-acetyltransferase
LALEQEFVQVDNSLHDLKSFSCGEHSMDQFLKKKSVKHNNIGLSQTYVLLSDVTKANKKQIACYFTLAISSVKKEVLPEDKKLPPYSVPIIILARLAVDEVFQNDNIGSKSLIYSLRLASKINDEGLPVYGVVLDVLNDRALEFYKKFNFFHEFSNDPMKLFVGMKTLKDL